MRIPSGVTTYKVPFVAVDATDFTTRETGLSSFTVYRSRDGGTPVAYTTPTIAEADATNMPGAYWLTVDEDTTIASGRDEETILLHITHAGMAPVTVAIELYRPKITVGYTLSCESDGDLTKVNTLDGHTPQTVDNATNISAIKTKTDYMPSVTAGAAGGLFIAGSNAATTVNFTGSLSGSVGSVTAAITLPSIPANWITAAGINSAAITSAKFGSGAITSTVMAANSIGASQIAADAIGASELATDAVTEIVNAVWAAAARTLTAATNFNNLSQSDIRTAVGMASANLDTQLTAIDNVVDAIVLDTAEIGIAGAGLTAAGGDLATAIATVDTVVDGIQADLSNGTDGLGAIKGDTAAILEDTGTTLPALMGTPAFGSVIEDFWNYSIAIAETIGNPVGTDISADIAAVKADTGTAIPALLPAALVGGRMDANMSAVAGSATAATNLSESALGIVPGECEGTPTTSVIQTNLAEATDDHYIGRVIVFTSGAAAGEASNITDYVGSTGTVTIAPVTTAPSATDKFVIV